MEMARALASARGADYFDQWFERDGEVNALASGSRDRAGRDLDAAIRVYVQPTVRQ
jgi:hypothetical protein